MIRSDVKAMDPAQRYTWRPIEDLPANWAELTSSELQSLASLWLEQSNRLEASGVLAEFHGRLAREWSIETGIIEGLYSIDRGTTQLLVEKGLHENLIVHGSSDKSPTELINILSVQQEALEGLFQFVANRRDLSNSYIKELHQVITRHQETVTGIDQFGNYVETALIRGNWKTLPNNPMRPGAFIHEYCPPEHVSMEMDRLMSMHKAHLAQGVPADVEAAWLHHRFAQIHPFQDGNGRVARALATLVFVRAGCFPLSIHRDDRESYVDALELADRGDMSHLVDLFVRVQKRYFLQALSLSESVRREHEPTHAVIERAVEQLKVREADKAQKQAAVFAVADELLELALQNLEQTAAELEMALRTVGRQFQIRVDRSEPATDFWFKKQIDEIAGNLGYYADTRTYSAWVRLKIREQRQFELVISLHSIGRRFVGLLGASAFSQYRDKAEAGTIVVDGPNRQCQVPFEFSYLDEASVSLPRFQAWLAQIVPTGLETWRRQL